MEEGREYPIMMEPELQLVEVEGKSRREIEWQNAMECLRWEGAVVRWDFAQKAGRLDKNEWWSLEDAIPSWY